MEFQKISEAGAAHPGHRIILYGPGGIGKTTLAAHAPGPVAFFDLDKSLPILAPKLAELRVGIANGGAGDSWDGLLNGLDECLAIGPDKIKTIVIDSATRAEELATIWTVVNIKTEKGNYIRRIEDYGYGKGYQHIYDTYLNLIAALDRHVALGRHVIFTAHDCTVNVPNPTGDDWLQYQPRLQSPNSGKASIRLRLREWADHLLCVLYDVDVKSGKGRGGGTRTVWPMETPSAMAKSRTLTEPLAYADNGAEKIWKEVIG